MRKRSLLVVSLLVCLMAVFLIACSDYDKDAAFNKVKERLNLQEAQVVVVKPVFDSQIEKATSLLAEMKNSRPQPGQGRPDFSGGKPEFQTNGSNPFMAKFQALTIEAEAKLAAVLTVAQIAEYNNILNEEIKALLEKNRPDSNGGGGPGMGGMPGGMGGMPGGRF